ncbi:hypothetical protein D8674_026469 [Pyrus ussuriensis x Pyrus communis]|uniref:Uncharacterized protein n=1 Tax=Pyrus ussuriensis x Pyrus communis TaxID=2448454 RepID=A0A5N5I6W8_9ROSA|nr:hypothetical protein D8674_026469 [Pyrus ussuriensis x Pyrus communis]
MLKYYFNYNLKDISPKATAYLEENLKWDDLEIACLEGCPTELEWPLEWEWLCKHFTDTKFVNKSVAGKKAWESKALLHHSSSMPFSYRVEEGSKFPELDMFNIYVRPGDKTTKQLHVRSPDCCPGYPERLDCIPDCGPGQEDEHDLTGLQDVWPPNLNAST